MFCCFSVSCCKGVYCWLSEQGQLQVQVPLPMSRESSRRPMLPLLDQTYQATLEALEDLDYRVLSTQKDGTEGEIEVKKVGGDSVKAKLSVSGRGTTLVKIRVGIFGDEAASRTIERKIASRLGF